MSRLTSLIVVVWIAGASFADITTHLSFDFRPGTRGGDDSVLLVYDSAWYADGVSVKITANNQEIVSGVAGAYVWTPQDDGVYLLVLNAFDAQNNIVGTENVFYVSGKDLTELVIPDGATEIGPCAFMNYDCLTSVTIPNSVRKIGDRAFYGCVSLRQIRLPWDVEIGKDAIPTSTAIVRPVFVAVNGQTTEHDYDGLGKHFSALLVPDTSRYDVANVTNVLPITAADVGEYQFEPTTEMFFNTNKAYDVTFKVESEVEKSEVKIVPRKVEITACSRTKTYDGTPLTCDEVTFGAYGFVGEDCVASARGVQIEVGTSKNVVVLNWAKGALESNYSIVTNEGTLTVLPAKVAKDGEEPGTGTKPVGGISKFDGEPVKYDGKGHTINVAALEGVTLVADTPVFSYSMTSNGVYRSEPYYFTNACVTSVWYKISAANYEDYVHEARVTILPREVTLTSGSASKNFDGTALRCESVEVTGDRFVLGEGVDVVYTGSQLWPGSNENTFTYSFKQGSQESNYDVTTANGTLTVGAAGRVVVDASVTAIPAEAFKNYTELTEVVLPDTVTEIGVDAFAGCTKLTKVAFPSGMGVTREKLRGWGLTDAVLDDYVEGDFIIVNASLLGYVGAADVAELVIPDGIELIDEYALSELYDLERVELPETVRYIGKGAFANDTYLDEVVLPDSVEVIGEGAFENCSWMQTMTMGAGVRSVGDRAFAGCTKLAAAKFAEGLGEVGDAAFSNCWRMMSVSLPVSVSNVAATAFKDCASLTGVTVPTMIAPMSEWFAPVYRQVENVTVPKGTTEVCAEMFAGCAALKTVDLPEGVTNIASGAFRDCVVLETILLPESLEAIGDEAFAGCAALKAIVLPKNVAVLGKRVFNGCTALADVTLSRALTAIPDGTFAGCDALDSFVVPEAVTELGSQIVPSATTAIYYLGNAPTYAADVYAGANASLVSYVVDGTKGWDGRPTSRDIPQTWPTTNARTIRTWSPVKVDVTFVGNGGAFGNPAGGSCVCEQIVDTAYSLPAYEPVRKGYRFAGYWTEANGGTRVTSGVSVKLTKAHSLYAHWAVGQSVTVRFNATGGTVEPEERVYVSEAPFGELPVPVRTHYDFAGWFTEASSGTRVTAASEVPLADRELFAHWTAKQYAIRFHANDGTERMTDQAFVYGATVTLAKNGFVREGYTFAGWAAAEDGGSTVYADGAVLEDVTAIQDGVIHLYAVWIKDEEVPVGPPEDPEEPVVEAVVTNTITYAGLEGVVNTNVTEFTTNDLPLVLGPVVREGWRFLGWMPNGGVIPVGTVTNVTFTANWEKVIEPPPVEPPEESEVNPWCEDADFSATAANTYDGYVIDEEFNLVGVVQVKTAKKDKKGKVTATATVTDANGKKWSYTSGKVTVDGVVTGLKCTTKGCPVAKFGVTLGRNGLEGEWNGYAIFGARQVKPKAAYVKNWTVSFENGDWVQLKVDSKGAVKFAGSAKGKAYSGSTRLIIGDGFAYVPVVSGKNAAFVRIEAAANEDGAASATVSVLSASSGEMSVGGITAKPRFDGWEESANEMVGVAYSARPVMDGLSWPLTFTASKLPTGCKINASTGVISGIPTKTGTFLTKVTATSKSNKKWTASCVVTNRIVALPEWAKGQFTGTVDGHALTMSVGSTGKVSGKFKDGITNWTFSVSSFATNSVTVGETNLVCRATAKGTYKNAKKKTVTVSAPIVFDLWAIPDVSPVAAAGAGDFADGADNVEIWRVAAAKLSVNDAKGGTVKTDKSYGQAAAGAKVKLTATLKKGYTLLGWYDEVTGELLSQKTSFSLVSDGVTDRFVEARFAKEADLSAADFTLDWSGPTNLTVGVKYSAQLTVSGAAAVKIASVSGLPKGLSYKSGKVSGVATTAKTNTVSVKVALVTNTKKTWTLKQTLVVEPLPDWACDTFTGDIGTEDEPIPVTVTVASSGKVSGKYKLSGATWTFSTSSLASRVCDEAGKPVEFSVTVTASATIKNKKKTQTLLVTVTPDGVVVSKP